MKEALLAHLSVSLVDGVGSTEGGIGVSVSTREEAADTAAFKLHPGVQVFTDEGVEVTAGSEEIGKIAVSGHIPLGYYKDKAKSRATFREIDGVRYSLPGDYAKVAPDGQLILLGRGSNCINTASENVFPEEVEKILKRRPAIDAAAVIGLPDETYGQRVEAVVAGSEPIDPAELTALARGKMSAYKIPRQIFSVKSMPRSPSRKMDYAWAHDVAVQATSGSHLRRWRAVFQKFAI